MPAPRPRSTRHRDAGGRVQRRHGDLNTAAATGTFASATVGSNITVTIAGLTLSGAQASDYSLTQPTTTANITPPVAADHLGRPRGDRLRHPAEPGRTARRHRERPGRTVYTPGPGAILDAGTRTLSLTFTPNDTTDYSTVTVTRTITVLPATPSLGLSAPGGTYNGTPFAASVTVAGNANTPAASLENVAPVLTYYAGSGTSGNNLGSTPPTAPGTYTVVASFPGSADYVAKSTSASFTINQGTANVALASSAGSAVYGQSVTFTATVGGGATSGTVTFFDGGTTLGTVALDGSSTATLTTSALDIGAQSITASYGGNADFVAATSAASPVSVAKAGSQVVLVPQAGLKKKKVTSLSLEAKIEAVAPGGGVPTGTVTFEVKKNKKKEIILGTVGLSGGERRWRSSPRAC